MQTSEQTDKIMPALAKALGDMPEVEKKKIAHVPTRSGGSYDFKYADIADVLKVVRPVLAKHDLFVMQDQKSVENGIAIQTRIMHSSGQWVESEWLTMPVDARHAQAVGSASTYGRRYSISGMLAIATEDDDGGETARNHNRNRKVEPNRTTPPKPEPNGSGGANGQSDEPKPIREQTIDLIEEWSEVPREELRAAVLSVARACGEKWDGNSKMTDAQWMRLYKWAWEQKEQGLSFAEAVKPEPVRS